MTGDGTPKISDFGLAKRLDDEVNLTRSGAIVGTPSFMAPEQATGSRNVGPATDTYALGAILYECLTGRPPYAGATAFETLQQVVGEAPTPPRRLAPSVPRQLEAIVLRCLEKEPSRRYASAKELADDLGRFLGEPIVASPAKAKRRWWPFG
jgi:serine/threonine protein kinase